MSFWTLGVRLRLSLAAVAAAVAAMGTADAASAASWRFEWVGGDGYRMVGAFSMSDAEAGAEIVDGDALACFVIRGFDGDQPIGVWRISQLTDATFWNFSFEPRTGLFPVGGVSFGPGGQEWNMSGAGDGCGAEGFGFNAGNAAQDLCVDDAWVSASSQPAGQPFVAIRDDTLAFAPDECRGPALFSGLWSAQRALTARE